MAAVEHRVSDARTTSAARVVHNKRYGDEEEVRMMRLYAAGKVTENLWDMQWQEWQDRRARIRMSLEGLEGQQQVYVGNFDAALKIIAQVSLVYNRLERSDQKELLRYMVERIIVDPMRQIRLELCAPFAYLQDISDQIRSGASAISEGNKAKTVRHASGLGSETCSDNVLSCWGKCSQFEHPSLARSNTTFEFIQQITFPQRALLARFTNL